MKSFVKAGLRHVLDFPQRRRHLGEWSQVRCAEGREPVLGFGGVLAPGQFVHGGAVKLLSLREGFSCDEQCFNILYLVSSAQPEFAEDLVKMCRRQGIAFVWNQNGVGYPGWAGADAECHNAPMRRLRAQADFVIYQSAFCRASAEKFLGPCDRPSAMLFNPVDLQKFSPRKEALSPTPLRLLAMGTQNYRERVVAALDCVRVLRAGGMACVLTIAGPLLWKNAQEDLTALMARLDLQDVVTLRAPFTQEEAPEIYREHDILLHPKYLDPCPTVVAEALACGLPVVASRSGGLPEMVDANCAELIEVPLVWDRMVTPSGDQWAAAVRSLVGKLTDASQAARHRAETLFDAMLWVQAHREIFTIFRK